jgi:signal transduction histidine kinase
MLVGVVSFGTSKQYAGQAVVILTDDAITSLTGGTGYNQVVASAAAGGSAQELAQRVAAALPGPRVSTGSQYRDDLANDAINQLSTFRRVLLIFAVIACVVSAFVIYNTFNILIAQRVREIALLRCVGAARGQIFGSVLLERDEKHARLEPGAHRVHAGGPSVEVPADLDHDAAVWLTGYTVRTRRRYVIGLEERAANAERERDHLATIAVAEERASIGRDLHDVVAHSMAVMIVQADGAGYALDSDPEQARLAIKQVASTGRDALEDMRRLVEVLRGTASARGDEVTDRRRIGLDQLDALVDQARSAGLAVTFEQTGGGDRMPAAVELTIYRIVQEALTNVLRHAGPAAAVRIQLRYSCGAVDLEVLDDGGGRLPKTTGSPAGGHGLVGMRERISVHCGRFDSGPRLGGGWRVAAWVPWT